MRRGLDAQLAIIGNGQHLPEMKQLAIDLQIHNRVEFPGQLPFGEPILSRLDQSHLFVMPSRQEGLPRALVEAMAERFLVWAPASAEFQSCCEGKNWFRQTILRHWRQKFKRCSRIPSG